MRQGRLKPTTNVSITKVSNYSTLWHFLHRILGKWLSKYDNYCLSGSTYGHISLRHVAAALEMMSHVHDMLLNPRTKSYCCKCSLKDLCDVREINENISWRWGEVMEVTFWTHTCQKNKPKKAVTAALIHCKTRQKFGERLLCLKTSVREQLQEPGSNIWEYNVCTSQNQGGNSPDGGKWEKELCCGEQEGFSFKPDGKWQKWSVLSEEKTLNEGKRIRGTSLRVLYCRTRSSAALLLLHCWSTLGQNWTHWVGWLECIQILRDCIDNESLSSDLWT